MYTEIKEMVHFLAIYMYHRILRRRHNNAVYCNPGEVTCRISGYSSLIIIWHGEVNEHQYCVPNPIGAARDYDGNILNFTNPSSTAYSKSDHSDPNSGTDNSSLSMFPNPSRSFTTSDQFAANFPSAPAIDSANQFLLWNNVISVENHTESVEYPIYNEFGRLDYIWFHTVSINDNDTSAVFGNDYDIWKSMPSSDIDNSIGSQFVNNDNNNTAVNSSSFQIDTDIINNCFKLMKKKQQLISLSPLN
uniref:Uncharacterized protein n=1 Tax=Onchocerca volvulus TaxID=6282 RepID=A0A8R1Y232_ONCVO